MNLFSFHSRYQGFYILRCAVVVYKRCLLAHGILQIFWAAALGGESFAIERHTFGIRPV